MLKGRASWLTKIAQAVLGTTVALIVLNFAFLAGGYFTGHQRMYMFDALLGWRVLPNLNAARTPYITYTDSHGFRILPGEPRDTTTYDVMLVGDSFCFGSWISAEQTLAGMLKLDHPDLRIANTAVPGYGTDQELLMLRRWAPMLKPGGTVILLTYMNDFDDIRDRWEEVREKPWFRMDGDALVLELPDSWANRLLWSAHIFSVTAYLTSLAFNLQPRIWGDDPYAARLYSALLQQMAQTVRARHARFVVLYTSGPNADTPAGKRWAGVVRRAAAQASADFFSLDDQGRLSPAMFAPDKIHWNGAGNRAVYNYIAPRIAPLLPAEAAGTSSTAR
jgi:GDSL-like Lipase/Acylhydrolase family